MNVAKLVVGIMSEGNLEILLTIGRMEEIRRQTCVDLPS
jgi:hypothetical protein